MNTTVLGTIAFVSAALILFFGLVAIRNSGRETAIKLWAAVALLSILSSAAFLSRIAQLTADVKTLRYGQTNLILTWQQQAERDRLILEPLRDKVRDMQSNLDTLNKMHQYSRPTMGRLWRRRPNNSCALLREPRKFFSVNNHSTLADSDSRTALGRFPAHFGAAVLQNIYIAPDGMVSTIELGACQSVAAKAINDNGWVTGSCGGDGFLWRK